MTAPEIHFVISAPRSGSTWLAQAMGRHADIFATEHRLFGNFCEMWPNNNGKLAPRITFDAYARALSVHYLHDSIATDRDQFQENFVREYCQFIVEFAKKSSGKKLVVDKITPYPGTTRIVIEQIKKYFPESQIFNLIRDGRDVATSGTFDWLLKDGHGTDRHQCFVDNDANVVVERFFDDQSLEKWANNWRETVQLPSASLEIRFEQMLAGLSDVLIQVFHSLGVNSAPDVAQDCAQAVTFEKMTGRSNGQMDPTAKQRNGTHGDWKNYFTQSDGQLFHSIAGNELLATGYVDSESWFHQLPQKLAIRYRSDVHGATQP